MQEIAYIWSSYSVCGDADADADADDDKNVLFKATYELLFMPTFAY